jgi:putative oxidoreductase
MFNLPNQKDWGLLVLRLAFGGMMLSHGVPKMMKMMSGDMQFADPIGVGAPASLVLTVFAEVVCAIMVLVGFQTKWAAFPVAFTMLVAAGIVHGADPIGKKELALLYLAGYLAISLLGAGKYSVDAFLGKDKA